MRIFFVAALLLLYTAFHPSPLRAGEVETVRFGVVMSLTGEFSDLGRMHLAGVRMRLAEFNRNALNNGFRLEMNLRDDRSDPETAGALARELLADPEMVGLVGASAGSTCAALMPVVRETGAVFVSPSATSTEIGKRRDGSFRILYSDAFQGEALARYMVESLGLKRAASIVNTGYAYCRDIGESFARALEAAGGNMVATASYVSDGSPDFAALLQEVWAHNPEVILLPVYAVDVAAILDEARALGVTAVFCGGDSWEQESVLARAAAGGDAYYVGVSDDGADSHSMRRFLRTLRVTTEPHAQLGSSLGYDALSVLIAGLRRGRSRRQLRDAMYGLGMVELVSGPLFIDEKGIGKAAYIMKVTGDGANAEREVVEVVSPKK